MEFAGRAARRVVATAAVLLAAGGGHAAGTHAAAAPADRSDPAAPVAAVWVEHDASFVYFGQTTYYSCHGLRDKVRHLMQRVGARPDDLKVRVSCVESGSGGVELMPRVQINAALPALATPERLQELADDSRRQLVAKVRGDGDERLMQFPAVPTLVQFDGSHRDPIEDGDCELLEQMVERVFAPMGIIATEGSRLSCMRHRVPVGSVMLRLATLQKAPDPDAPPASARPPH